MDSYVVTSSMGKRIIGKAVARHPAIKSALQSGTIVIIAGTTNGYVAEEILSDIGQAGEFSRRRFFRGVTLPPASPTTDSGRLPDESLFPGDVVITKGEWLKGKTIFDVIDELEEGDVILKGANAVDASRKNAGILIGNPSGGTIAAAMHAVVGHRVRLIIPVGLEKRIEAVIPELAGRINSPGSTGPRIFSVAGVIITEIEAIAMLAGAETELIAAGGVCGAEGAVWLGVKGTEKQMNSVKELISCAAAEPAFEC